jgi:antitoxin (DNA-binding transcriptional repressor) of toxin-antitoxin stability system
MKTASVRELRQDFPRIEAWIEAGEKVAITRRRQPVATLVPCRPKPPANRSQLNLTRRLQKIFGQHLIPNQAMQAILDQDRGAR